MRFVSAEEMTSAAVLAVHAWYRTTAGDGWPARDSFRPELLPGAVLPHLALVDVETAPFRVLYRVVGSVLCESVGRHVRMQYLDELGLPQEAELTTLFRHAVQAPGPVYVKGAQPMDGQVLRYEGAGFPFGSPADRIRRLVIVEDFLDTDSWRTGLRHRHYRVDRG